MSLLTIAAFCGSALGATSGGFINQYLGWRYIQYVMIGLAAAMTAILYFSSETRGSKILSDRKFNSVVSNDVLTFVFFLSQVQQSYERTQDLIDINVNLTPSGHP